MDSVRRTSNTRSKGCFVKKFYDLPKANLSHAEECLKCGILLIKDLCLAAQSSQVERKAWLLR